MVDQSVSALLAGRGSLLLVDGPRGVGKTRLLAEVADRTVLGGGRVLSGRAVQHQRTVPFAPLLDATLNADPPVGDANSLRMLSLGLNEGLPYSVVLDLQFAVAEAARVTPVSFTIDDAHLADAGTLAALRLLMAGWSEAPILCCLTMRSGPMGGPVRDAVESIVGRGANVERVRLTSVDPDAAADIARDVLGADIDVSVLRLVAMAEGNPSLILELLTGLREEERICVARGVSSAAGTDLPRRLLTAMDDRLTTLSPLARQVAQVAAVLPERFSVPLLAQMVERRPAELLSALTEAIDADLLVDEDGLLKFRQEMLRHAVRGIIPRPLLRALERDSAAQLMAQGAAPEEVAMQLARSAEVGDVAAVQSLRAAARSVVRSNAARAADLSQLALGLVGFDDALRGDVTVETIDLLVRASRFVEAEELALKTLSTVLPQETEARIRLNLSAMSVRPPAERAADNRMALALPGIEPRTRIRNLAWLAYNSWLDGEPGAGPTARDALELSSDGHDGEAQLLAATTAAGVALAEGYGWGCVAILDDRRRVADEVAGGSAAAQVSAAVHPALLTTLGRLDEANALIGEGNAAAEARGDVTGVRAFEVVRAMSEHAAGHLNSARGILEPIFRQCTREWSRWDHHLVLSTLSSIALDIEDQSLIRDTNIAAVSVLKNDAGNAVRHQSVYALVHTAWQRNDLDGAVRLLTGERDLTLSPLWPTHLDHIVLVARLAAATGDPTVRRHARAALALLDREEPAVPLFAGLARHVRGLLEQDANHLEEADGILAGCSRPLLHAGALEDCGTMCAQRDRDQTAIDRLNRAFDVYAEYGAFAGAHRVSKTLRTLGVSRRIPRRKPRAGWDSLTASELKVVELVAQGATNPAAAKRLVISPHTVNTHLRHAYTKLNISSRAELMRLARGAGEVPVSP